ncbi:MAG: hypothetical protein ABI182_08630 [Candidatus Baltobacteraceae bacterium]
MKFRSISIRRVICALPLALLLVLICATFARAADVVYAFADDGIYSLNSSTGAATALYTGAPFPGAASTVQAGATRPSDGIVFFLFGGGANQALYSWNPATPATAPTALGNTGAAVPLLPRLAFDAGGNLIGMDGGGTPHLYTISQTTGVAATGAAVTGVPAGGGDLALSSTGVLYMAVAGELYSITEAGGAATNIGAVGGAGNITGISFGPGGVLYGVDNGNPSNVYTINTGTGAGTLIGTASRIGAGNMGDLGSVLAPDLHLTKTDDSGGGWTVGQNPPGNYSLTPDNISGSASTIGTITVTDTMPSGITPISTTGSGVDWSCGIVGQTVTCTSSAVIAPGNSGTTIVIQVNIGTAAEPSVTNTATVSGGGSPPYNVADGTGVKVTTISAAAGSAGNLFLGPVDAAEPTYLGADLTGSYDGAAPANNNYDFTAAAIPFPANTVYSNTGTVLGSPIGGPIASASVTINVPNQMYYHNTAGATKKVTFSANAPDVPAGWAVQICPDNGSGTAPNCAAASQANCTTWVVGLSAQTSISSCKVAANATVTPIIWAIYTTPSNGLVAFSRYDATIDAKESAANDNQTYNEFYAGYIPLTKTQFVVKNGCPPGENPAPGTGVCPGGIIQYQVDYRNIMVGAGLGTEGALASAFITPQAGTLTITENGGSLPSTWAGTTKGLTALLVAGATAPGAGPTQTTCGLGGNCGDTTTGSTFTGNALLSTLFTVNVGGATFRLFPANFAGQTSQGTIIFAVTVK